jgi:membrane-bound lytic murein transglycosylase D
MAPDSRFWRHQLGDARRSLQHNLLKTSLMVFLMMSMSTVEIQARTDCVWGSGDAKPIPLFEYVQPFPGESIPGTSLFPPNMIPLNPPAGRWSNRIQIHIPNQPAIQQYIRFFTGQGRPTFEDALARSRPYVPVMTEILVSQGVPADMVSVVLIESCFRRHASYGGAVGYWQLLAATARSVGLRVDRWVDDRRDPIKSTEAAAKYLRSFYDQFHSWPLALAAYNAGEIPVAGAMRRGRTSDFWELSRRGTLPGHTRAYVPKVLAAIQIMRDLEAHGFEYPRHYPVYDFESISIMSPLRLQQVAEWLRVPVSYLQDLNPSLRLDRLPPDCGVNLNLPSGARDKFDLAYKQYLRN